MPTYNHTAPADEQFRINFAFIKKLWSAEGDALRKALHDQANQAALHAMLRSSSHGFDIPDNVKIIVVDIEGARTSTFGAVDATDTTYFLVLPPKPIKSTNSDYVAMQSSLEAYFHASNDGYGM